MSDCSKNAFKVPGKPELLPCPFCGSNPVIEGPEERLAGVGIGIGYMISCPNENCFLGTNDSPISWEWLSEAIEAWNQRYEPTCQWEYEQYEECYLTSCGGAYTWEPAGLPDYCPGCGASVEVVG